ncbi:helix-turn-helix transcriptional regulator [Streptosporangium sp. NBC_01756]|uniref:helix-turn-helix transcriptional regulator n=1 Tax=Streptosporangium sp. NBC_01756 TaxID=2975950 RepID=UPI002DD83711|nr:AAA family ATPase [Streptosporangium sp. NBC_01756]WSC89923.1 AAA family ATPase [Streptosporangium sp. NBC_01756]
MATDGGTAAGRMVSPVLVGREDQLRRLVTAVSRPPAVVVLEGEAGIGKTRLVTEMAAHPDVVGRLILLGSARRIREPFPLGPVVEALHGTGELLGQAELSPVAGALRGLLPELARVLPSPLEPLDDRAAERHRLFRGLVEVLNVLGPVALVMEDLHWADEQTVEFLAYLLTALPVRMSVVLTYRGEEAGAGIREVAGRLADSVFHDHLVLETLDAEQTRVLAASILDMEGVTPDFGTHLHELSSGLPLAVQELLALLRERGALIQLRSGRWARRALVELDVPPGVRDSVRERVGRLPAAARGVAEAAAVLQVPVRVAVLEQVSGLPRAETVAGLDELLVSGLLAEQDGTATFRHVLAAQAVYGGIPLGRRQDLHARAAAAVRSVEPVPLGQEAHHLRQAGLLREWVDAAEQAAGQASELGDDAEAVRILEDVLRNAPLEPERRGRLAVRLGWAAGQVLRPPEVIDLLSEALESEQPGPSRGQLHFLIGLLQERLGDDPGAQRRAFTAAVDDLGDRPELAAWVMAALGRPTGTTVTLAEHTMWLDRALEVVPAIGDPVEEVFVLGKIAASLSGFGDPRWAVLTDGVRRRTGGRPRHRQEVNAYRSIAENVCCAGHFDLADQLLAAASQGAAGEESSREPLARCRLVALLLAYCQGAWDGLDQETALLLDEYGGRPSDRITAETVAACLALAQGDLDTVRRELHDVVRRTVALGGYELLPLSVTGFLRLSTARGEAAAALAVTGEAVTVWQTKGLWPLAVRAVPALAEAMVDAGRHDDAAELIARLSTQLDGLDAPMASAALPHARGHLAAGHTAAAEQFLAASSAYDLLGARYEAAQARGQAAERLFAAGDARAVKPLHAAIATFQGLGARWDLDRVAQLARKHGVTVKGRYPGGPQGYGAGLSPREREIAEMAAAGLTNREIGQQLFVSPRTVEKHLGAVLRKLGLRSRTALGTHLGVDRDGS